MADLRDHTEPSMEEILASIRRIIVEDNGPQSLAPAGQAEAGSTATVIPPAPPSSSPGNRGASVAQSFRVAGADPSIKPFPAPPPNLAPARPDRAPPVQEAILDLTERIDEDDLVHRAAEALPSPAQPPISAGRLNRPPPLKGTAPPASEPGMAPRPAAEVAASIATLTRIASVGQTARQPELPLGEIGRTLEDMVRELLRPPLKEWLDANLPRLVERIVRDEINRLVRDAQER